MGNNKKSNRSRITKGKCELELPEKGTYWFSVHGRHEADGKGNTKTEWKDGKPPQLIPLKGKYRGK